MPGSLPMHHVSTSLPSSRRGYLQRRSTILVITVEVASDLIQHLDTDPSLS